jgi:hypothetical protein
MRGIVVFTGMVELNGSPIGGIVGADSADADLWLTVQDWAVPTVFPVS